MHVIAQNGVRASVDVSAAKSIPEMGWESGLERRRGTADATENFQIDAPAQRH